MSNLFKVVIVIANFGNIVYRFLWYYRFNFTSELPNYIYPKWVFILSLVSSVLVILLCLALNKKDNYIFQDILDLSGTERPLKMYSFGALLFILSAAAILAPESFVEYTCL